ncbi:hypothetical protein GCM10009552_40330 [Rothia nasimurium]
MCVRLALHIRGLPPIPFDVLKLVGHHFLSIPPMLAEQIVRLLAEIEFVRLGTEGTRIKTVVPDVPYYEDMYAQLGQYAIDEKLNEAEQLSVALVHRLSKTPENLEALRAKLGAENKLFTRAVAVGVDGSYLKQVRARGRDILLTPTHFAENPELFADIAAKGGARDIQKVFDAIRSMQGVPLSLIQKTGKLGNTNLTKGESDLAIRLAQDGLVKPPSITTSHAGENFFLFTPTPGGAALAPTKRDIYEKAMATVAAVRQGQFLSNKYKINNPAALLYVLKRDLKLGRATTEAAQQYQNLTHLRIARLDDVGGGFKQLQIINTPENIEALDIAYDLVNGGVAQGIEVDDSARFAIQQDQTFVESLIATTKLQKTKKIALSDEQQEQLDLFFIK